MWQSALTAEGRKYYYKAGTNETTWEKPDDFVEGGAVATPPAAGSGDWREAKAADGRTYYYNAVTKVTTWEKPENFNPAPAAITSSDFNDRRPERRDTFHAQPSGRGGFDEGRTNGKPWEGRTDAVGFRGPLPSKSDEPEYASPEEAEAAFFKFLRSHGIKYDAEWKDVIRAVAREKGFRALKDPYERRQAFEKYCTVEKATEKSKELEKKTKQREQFKEMLNNHDEITHYTRWKTARPLIEREVVFRNVADDEERKQMFREYVTDLQKRHAEEEKHTHERALSELSILLRALVMDSQLKWKETLETLESNKRYISNEEFRSLSKADILRAYETHIRIVDAEKNDTKQKLKHNQLRGQRLARDGFKELLQEHLQAGQVTTSTKWKDFHPRIAQDPRYQNLLGMPGSNPLELFWDVLEDEERRLRTKREDVYDVLQDEQYEMTTTTAYEEFERIMLKDSRTKQIVPVDMLSIYERLMEKIKRRDEEDRIHAEKDRQHAIDALRSAIKHARPAINVDDRYEDVTSRIDALPEARGLDEEARHAAFEKYVKRAQEKGRDREKDRTRRDRERHRESSHRSYDDDRERDRRHRTRSPELDAYEEDRRKAQAARERQYRKASFGLTPPPRDRRDDRSEGDRRHESLYDRERREQELRRERSYISRADPRDRGKVSTLDYGDEDYGESNSGSTRKRGESEVSATDKRDAKRLRRGGRESTTQGTDKDDGEVQSGSEEGEIEEV